MFAQAKDDGGSLRRPPHILNPIRKSSPKCRVRETLVQEIGDFEENGQAAPISKDVSKSVQD
jgi:hypothetical protein